MVSAELVRSCPLFAGINTGDLEAFVGIFEQVRFDAEAYLTRQGQPADHALIIESGNADVVTALPGGGEATVARLGPGSVLGEMALLEAGMRSATVVARTPLSACRIERDGFRLLLARRNDAAFRIQHRITLTLCKRLRELNARILACDAPENTAPALSRARVHSGASRGACSFDYKAFLPLLPVFRRFGKNEIEAFAARAPAMELARGVTIFEQGAPSAACYVVVRGAVEVSSARNGRRHRIGVIGPGQLCGHMGLIDGSKHSTTAVAREPTVLLELSSQSFGELYDGRDPFAAKFQDAINQNLLQALARTNNHLTRLISQARIRGGSAERKEADELQRALSTQDCRAA